MYRAINTDQDPPPYESVMKSLPVVTFSNQIHASQYVDLEPYSSHFDDSEAIYLQSKPKSSKKIISLNSNSGLMCLFYTVTRETIPTLRVP